jgi:hypothetical protein
MDWPIDGTKVVLLDEFKDSDPEEEQGVRKLAERGRKYLESFRWCEKVERQYVGIGLAGIVGVFLCDIVPTEAHVDDRVWVVMGDLPPAYITTEHAPNPACALLGYVEEMQSWVDAVRRGESVDELIPVNVEPTQEYATMLDTRLDILRRHLDDEYGEDLQA